MNATKAESPQMEDPFIYAPQPTSKVQAVTQAGTRPSIHVSLYAYGGISAACMMSWVDLTATFARSDRQTDLRTIREDALISRKPLPCDQVVPRQRQGRLDSTGPRH